MRLEEWEVLVHVGRVTYNLAETHPLEIIKIYYPKDIFSGVSRSL